MTALIEATEEATLAYPGECVDIVGQILGPIQKGKESFFYIIEDAILDCDPDCPGASTDVTIATVRRVEEEDLEEISTSETRQMFMRAHADDIGRRQGIDVRKIMKMSLPPAFMTFEDYVAGITEQRLAKGER
ncbi:hypothetical protein SEA_CHEWYVIII_28 [Rhodococcus phage ChewyVIII]|uniref:Uncharacterized protein n=1 Tax=Rhodococcus phage ChewyVIII TaxID=1887657 RepID=A0A1C9EI70_9CAUD|nr:hypothetical protein QEH30_gp28 [Rhodococcus phage ChewyVIII]AON97450.1 hypothetical protein SEA_CHEWYVIII_28 [Rhodococcus phage ChewyVIII]